MRRAARTDDNHAAIAAAFRRLGATVAHTHQIGSGFPDLVVCIRGRHVVLVEIKDGKKSPSAQKLTPAEEAFHALWPVEIVKSEDDVVNLINRLK